MRKILLVFSLVVGSLFSIKCSSDSGGDTGGQGNQDGKGGSLAVFAINGDYLYSVDDRSLNVFWIASPSNPTNVGRVDIGFDIETIFGLDDYLFIGSERGMYIYDITHPENPKKLSESMHFRACDPVVANNSHAFVTLHSNAVCGNSINVLQVYDIAKLTNPKLVHQRNLVQPRGLALYENHLIICDDELKIFNIENPEEPVIVRALPYKYKDVVIYNNILFAFGENRITQFKWENNDFVSLEPISSLVY